MIGKTMLFNPFNGRPRHPSDIQSDPAGILVWDGEEPLKAASRPTGEKVLTFTLDTGHVNHLMLATMRECMQAARRARWTNVVTRKDGIERAFEADWLKHFREKP